MLIDFSNEEQTLNTFLAISPKYTGRELEKFANFFKL